MKVIHVTMEMYSRCECLGLTLQKTNEVGRCLLPSLDSMRMWQLQIQTDNGVSYWWVKDQEPNWLYDMVSGALNNFWWRSQGSIIFPFLTGSCIPGNYSVYNTLPKQISQHSIYLKMNYALGSGFWKVILFGFNDINVYYVIWKKSGVLDRFCVGRTVSFSKCSS